MSAIVPAAEQAEKSSEDAVTALMTALEKRKFIKIVPFVEQASDCDYSQVIWIGSILFYTKTVLMSTDALVIYSYYAYNYLEFSICNLLILRSIFAHKA
ncbi:MAG: hypothetical protein IKM31_02790 [Oscillospiraceae bacterium]|nr:hypothetical protein [Oscillospiraceae bacterium]